MAEAVGFISAGCFFKGRGVWFEADGFMVGTIAVPCSALGAGGVGGLVDWLCCTPIIGESGVDVAEGTMAIGAGAINVSGSF